MIVKNIPFNLYKHTFTRNNRYSNHKIYNIAILCFWSCVQFDVSKYLQIMKNVVHLSNSKYIKESIQYI